MASRDQDGGVGGGGDKRDTCGERLKSERETATSGLGYYGREKGTQMDGEAGLRSHFWGMGFEGHPWPSRGSRCPPGPGEIPGQKSRGVAISSLPQLAYAPPTPQAPPRQRARPDWCTTFGVGAAAALLLALKQWSGEACWGILGRWVAWFRAGKTTSGRGRGVEERRRTQL